MHRFPPERPGHSDAPRAQAAGLAPGLLLAALMAGVVALVMALVAICLLSMSPINAAAATAPPGAGQADAKDAGPPDVCPLTTPTYTASLDAEAYQGRVGQPTRIRIKLAPPKAPIGFFVTSLVDIVQAPHGEDPSILTGFPEIMVTPREPGDYRLEIRVNLIAKSSCGGVKAATIMDREIMLRVAPAEIP